MNSRAIGGLVAAAVAGIVGYVLLKRFLDREMPEVAQFPDNEPGEFAKVNSLGRVNPEDRARVVQELDEALAKYPEGWTRRERPQRHEEPQEHGSEAEISG